MKNMSFSIKTKVVPRNMSLNTKKCFFKTHRICFWGGAVYSERLFSLIGTSVRRSSRSAFGRSTGNNVSGHYKRHYFFPFFWHERAAFQRLAFGRSTAGNDVSGHYKRHYFLFSFFLFFFFFFFSVVYFSHRRSARIKKLI